MPLKTLIEAARERQRLSLEACDDWVVGYVDSLVAPLAEVQMPISGRRAAMLRRSIHFVHGAREALGSHDSKELRIDDSALDALRWGLPHRARGRPWAESTLLALYRHAVELAGESLGSPLARLRNEPDQVRRIALALAPVCRAAGSSRTCTSSACCTAVALTNRADATSQRESTLARMTSSRRC